MPSFYGKEFDAVIRRLRRSGLADRPFRVRTVPPAEIPDCDGDYCAGLIRIARGMSFVRARETLAHEFAHHLDAFDESTRNPHRASWGAHFARVETFLTKGDE